MIIIEQLKINYDNISWVRIFILHIGTNIIMPSDELYSYIKMH